MPSPAFFHLREACLPVCGLIVWLAVFSLRTLTPCLKPTRSLLLSCTRTMQGTSPSWILSQSRRSPSRHTTILKGSPTLAADPRWTGLFLPLHKKYEYCTCVEGPVTTLRTPSQPTGRPSVGRHSARVTASERDIVSRKYIYVHKMLL